MKTTFFTFLFFIPLSIFSQVQKTLVLNPILMPFYHGVASGDPLSDRVIIWTRLTPDTNWVGAADVFWRVATDTNMTNIVQSGTFSTDQSRDFTVKVDVTGLQPNTWYFYEFTNEGCNSVIGRTKTAPVGQIDSLRFAVVSCANYEAGYFNVYKVIKEKNDIDAIIHLGDYIYEYEHDGYAFNETANRIIEPTHEITVLNDYRTRYSIYHLDEDLMRLHQQFPFYNIWDDHESADDSYKDGADNHTEGAEGLWIDRKKYSQQAYFEWIPIREQAPNNDSIIYRVIPYGDLVDFILLDTRIHGRDEQVATTSSAVNDTSRTILGNDQFTWLKQNLSSSTQKWKILAQQVMIAPLEISGTPVNSDQWDGYAADRLELMNYILDNNITDVVALTGDIHTSWANDIPTNSYQSNGTGSAFVEFVTPSVTSPGLTNASLISIIQSMNNHIKYINLTKKGFLLLDINQQRTQSDWFFVNTIDNSNGGYISGESWYVNDNERHLNQAAGLAVPRVGIIHYQAPTWPRACGAASIDGNTDQLKFTMVYPNPVNDILYFQFYSLKKSDVQIIITDEKGSIVYVNNFININNGLNNFEIPFVEFSNGIYILKAVSNNKATSIKVIKN